ncbi:MAG: hypothetical protein JOZ51_03275 [Chloroflexi bacterium]|nr:hypothetical protein [Chloroflexota bacterium]
MNPLYQAALNGTLKSPASAQKVPIRCYNDLDVPVYIRIVDTAGNLTPPVLIPAKTGNKSLESYLNWYMIFTSVASGAFIGVIQLDGTQVEYDVTTALLVRPNDIGRFPVPSGDIMIPTDSPLVMVGCGTAPNGNPVTREQFWKRSSDSYMLAPNEKHTVGYSTTSGMQSTTSNEQTISTSLGMSSSFGWGPISASVSASLSTSSRSLQQVTVSSETTRYETVELSNTTDKPQMYLKWQLTDIITIFQPGTNVLPVASIVQANEPILIGGPYTFSTYGERLLPRAEEPDVSTDGDGLLPHYGEPSEDSQPVSDDSQPAAAGG